MNYSIVLTHIDQIRVGDVVEIDGILKTVGEERKQELLDGIQKGEANYFVCHKGSLTGNDQLCCRGWYDANQTASIVVLAKALGVVKFVPVPKVGEKK